MSSQKQVQECKEIQVHTTVRFFAGGKVKRSGFRHKGHLGVASLLALVILPADQGRGGPNPPFDREVDLATHPTPID
eukprot:1738120-Pleurochrysis_carterae.AAC.1